MWVKCQYEKCSNPNHEENPHINSPINLDFIGTVYMEYDKDEDRHQIVFYNGIEPREFVWYYIFEYQRDEDYEKILKLLGLK